MQPNQSTQAIAGTNTMFRSPLQQSIPDFITRALGTPQDQTFRPAMADLGAVNPIYRPIYQRFNDTLADLQRSEELLRNQSSTSRDLALSGYNRGIQTTEQQRLSNIDQARRAAQDAQVQNRIRARAVGGAPSSAFLELGNRIDTEAQRGIVGANTAASNRMGELENMMLQSILQLEHDLNRQIAAIESDRRLSLRERDNAILQAEEQARARAAQIAYINSLTSGDGSGTTGTPRVEGLYGEIEVNETPQYDTGIAEIIAAGLGRDPFRQAPVNSVNQLIQAASRPGAHPDALNNLYRSSVGGLTGPYRY